MRIGCVKQRTDFGDENPTATKDVQLKQEYELRKVTEMAKDGSW